MTSAGGALIDSSVVFEKIALQPGMRVADLGCGRTGHFVFPAAKVVGDTGIVYAVEIVKNILESIHSRVKSEGYGNVQTIWSDIEAYGKTPIPAGSLNVCFMTNVLFMVRDKVAALREAARLLGQEGLAVIIDWRDNLGPLGPKPENMLTPEALESCAQEANLTPMGSFSLGGYHFCSVFKKL